MSEATLEDVLARIDSLSPRDRRQLRSALKEDSSERVATAPLHEPTARAR